MASARISTSSIGWISYPLDSDPRPALILRQELRAADGARSVARDEVFASGLTPLIAAALLHYGDGKPWFIAGYMVCVAFVSLVSVYFLEDRTGQEIEETVPAVAAPA